MAGVRNSPKKRDAIEHDEMCATDLHLQCCFPALCRYLITYVDAFIAGTVASHSLVGVYR